MSAVDPEREAMKLPAGKTCGDCAWFKRTCEWLISCNPSNTSCDWHPHRFRPLPPLPATESKERK